MAKLRLNQIALFHILFNVYRHTHIQNMEQGRKEIANEDSISFFSSYLKNERRKYYD